MGRDVALTFTFTVMERVMSYGIMEQVVTLVVGGALLEFCLRNWKRRMLWLYTAG